MLYAGIDEVGVSSIAGPVVAAVVILPENHRISELPIDSKRLDEDNIKRIANKIKEEALYYKICKCTSEEIEEYSINYALIKIQNKLANAVRRKYSNIKIIVDGNRLIPALKKDANHEGIEQADSKLDNVSAAAIIAKDYCDEEMRCLDIIYPGYNFKKNKGYPVAEHIEAIKVLGISEAHRKSMAIKELERKSNLNNIIESTNISNDVLTRTILLLRKFYKIDSTLFTHFQLRILKINSDKILKGEKLSPKVQYCISKTFIDVAEKYYRKYKIINKMRSFFRNKEYVDNNLLEIVEAILKTNG